jgi:uncharacterized protein YcfJ
MHLSVDPRPARRRAGHSLALAGLVAALALGGCTMSETEQRTVSGAGIGAAAGAAGGALIGALVGVPGTGAAIGAAAGAALGGTGGYIHDQQVQRNAATSDAAQLQRENEELRRQLELQQQQQ